MCRVKSWHIPFFFFSMNRIFYHVGSSIVLQGNKNALFLILVKKKKPPHRLSRCQPTGLNSSSSNQEVFACLSSSFRWIEKKERNICFAIMKSWRRGLSSNSSSSLLLSCLFIPLLQLLQNKDDFFLKSSSSFFPFQCCAPSKFQRRRGGIKVLMRLNKREEPSTHRISGKLVMVVLLFISSV